MNDAVAAMEIPQLMFRGLDGERVRPPNLQVYVGWETSDATSASPPMWIYRPVWDQDGDLVKWRFTWIGYYPSYKRWGVSQMPF